VKKEIEIKLAHCKKVISQYMLAYFFVNKKKNSFSLPTWTFHSSNSENKPIDLFELVLSIKEIMKYC